MARSLRVQFQKLYRNPLGLALIGLAVFCAAGDFLLVRSAYFNADNVESFNALNGFLKGNIFLKGWSFTTDNFYLSDLSLFVIGSVFLGFNTALIYLVPYVTLLCLIGGAVLLVWQHGASSREKQYGAIAVLLLIGLPFTQAQSILVVSGCHGAIIAYSVFGLLAAHNFLTKSGKAAFWLSAFSLIVFIVTESDPQADVYFVAPFILLAGLRAWLFRTMREREIILLASLIVFAAAGSAFPYILGHIGGFHIVADVSGHFVPSLPDLIHSIIAFIRQMAMSFDAVPLIVAGLAGHRIIALGRLLVFLAVIALGARIFWNLPYRRDDIIRQWLLLGILILAAADVMSALFAGLAPNPVPGSPTFMFRYVTPAYIYASLAAIIEGQSFFSQVSGRALKFAKYAAAVTSIVFLAGAGEAILKAAREPVYLHAMPELGLADWLTTHGLTYGVGDYWTAQMLNALTRGSITADSIRLQNGLAPYHWAGDSHDIDSGRKPQFVIFTPVNEWNISLPTITAAYGAPAAVYTVNGFTVAVLKPGL